MKKQLLILLLILSVRLIYAQTITIKGKITDQNNKPVEYASIGLIGTTMGTVSNTEGSFIFKIPHSYKDKTLKVTSLGYENYSITVSEIKDRFLKIQLVEKTYNISEVVIKPEEAEDIVRKALENIPLNYPTEPINMEGFYREMTFENDTCVELAEAACEFYYSPYNEIYNRKEAFNIYNSKGYAGLDDYYRTISISQPINPNDKICITEARASDLHHKHRFKVVPNSGPAGIAGLDWIKQNNTLKNGEYIKNHKFKILDIIENDNHRVYKIQSNPKFSSRFYFILYIDVESYAIVMMEDYNYPYKNKRNYYWTPALYKKSKRRCKDIEQHTYRKLTTKYKKIEDKWYLSFIKYEHEFDYVFSKHYIHKANQDKISYYLQSELLINNIKTKDVKKIPDSTVLKNTYFNVLYEYDLSYNKAFWDDYNTIALTSVQDSIIKQLEKYQSIEKQYSDKFIKDKYLKAPIADEISCINPHTKIEDEYYWMQDIKNQEVLKYVEKENHYTRNFMLSLEKTKRNLFLEMIKRNVNDTTEISDKRVNGEYEYYDKEEKGANYANIFRRKINENKEELILDIAKKAQHHPSYWADIKSISPDNTIFAYCEVITSGYDSRIVFKNLNTGKNIDSLYKAWSIIWKKNNKEFLYTSWDDRNRIDKLSLHKISSNPKDDKTIYYEKNKFKNISLKLLDKKYVLLESSNDFYYNNIYLIDLDDEHTTLKEIVLYQKGFSHAIQIKSDTLYSLTNEPNGKTILYYSCMNNPHQKHWKKLVENTNNSFFSGFNIYGNYIVILEKDNNMQTRFRIIDKKGRTVKILEFDEEETYTIGFEKNNDLSENTFRFYYESLATLPKVFEYNIEKDTKIFIKQEKVNGYIAKYYKTKLLWATSKDGVKVPISIVYNKKAAKLNGKSPLYLTTYGSYGNSITPNFNPTHLSLLDRGIVIALAHVRGGSELGEKWHEDAMQMKKKNTFNDFIACAEHLIENKYTSKGKIIAEGGSAGGLVMGVIANQRPELFNTILLGAAYLDVLGVITDTTARFVFEERGGDIGNPDDQKMYEYIKSYSPYQNIKKQDYPNMLFLMGLTDTRVEYWQILRTVAKLRKYKTDNNTLLLKTDLYAGHNGYSGNFAYMAEDAFVIAFILNNLGIKY